MNAAKTAAVAGVVVGMLASAYAQTAGPETGAKTPTSASKLTATIYVSNGNSVIAYAPGGNGNVAPIASIGNESNGLVTPWGIALDSDGRIYIASFEGGLGGIGAVSVYRGANDGDATAIATITGPRTGLNHPFGIAVDSSRKIYVANFLDGSGTGSATVYPAGSNGNVAPIATIIGGDTGLDNPSGIAVDSNGRIYAANRGGGHTSASSITVYPAGSNGNVKPIATIAGPDTGLDDPCIAVDSSGKIYAGNTSDRITVYAAGSNGNVKPIATIVGPDKGDRTGLSQPNGIALDAKGNIYAANAVATGLNVTVYGPGSNGNVPPIATLNGSARGTQGVAVDLSGKIYVTTQFNEDTYNDTSGAVTVFSPLDKGDVKPIAVMHPAANTGIGGFGGIAVDSNGKIYATKEFDYGRVMTYAPGSNGDVKPIATIEGDKTGLYTPMKVALDSSGNLYVSNLFVQRPTGGMGQGNVTVYAAGSDGNVTPIEAFRTGLLKWNGNVESFFINGKIYRVEHDGTIVTSNSAANPSSGSASQTPVMIDDLNDVVRMLRHPGDLPPIIKIRGYAGIPTGLAVDSNGNVYLSYDWNRILVYSPGSTGYVSPSAEIAGPDTGLAWPNGIAVDSSGKIYVVNRGMIGPARAASVTIYPAGSNGDVKPIVTISGPNTGLDQHLNPHGIAIDSSGNIYVVNRTYGENEGGRDDQGGSVNIYRAGSDGDVAPIARISGPLTTLRYPEDIAVGPPMESP